MRMIAVAVSISALLLLHHSPPLSAQGSPVALTLTTDHTAYEPGSIITFTVIARNTTNRPLTLDFLSKQRFDVVIHAGAVEVARWSSATQYEREFQQFVLAPAATYSLSGTWAPYLSILPGQSISSPTQPLGTGVYTIAAELTVVGTRPTSAPRSLVIGHAFDLSTSCTMVPTHFAAAVPVTFVADLIDPPSALSSVWGVAADGTTASGYSPGGGLLNDLRVVNPGDTLSICANQPARIIVP